MPKAVDVTEHQESVADFLRSVGPIREPIDIVLGDQVVARLLPPGALSDEEKEEILRKGWQFVERARARSRGVSEREIAAAVDAAVKKVRSGQ